MNEKLATRVLMLFPLLLFSCDNFNHESQYNPTISDFKICPTSFALPSNSNNILMKDDLYELYTYSYYPFLDEFEFVTFNEGSGANITSINENELLTQQDITIGNVYYHRFQIIMPDFANTITSAIFKWRNEEFEIDIGKIKKTESYGEENPTKDIFFRPSSYNIRVYSDYGVLPFQFYLYNGILNSLDKIKINDTYVDFTFDEDLSSLEKNKEYTIEVKIPREVINFEKYYGVFTFTLEYQHNNTNYVNQSTSRYNYGSQLSYITNGYYNYRPL